MLADGLGRLLADRLPPDRRREVAYAAPFHDPGLWQALAELGLPAMLAPESVGGFGGGGFDIAAVFEPLGHALCPEPMLGHAMALSAFGAIGLQAGQAVSGERIWAMAVAEPDTPYGLDGLATQAVRTSSGWALSGRKSVVYGGPAATDLMVAAVHEDGLGVFAVEAEHAQITGYGMVDGGGAAEVFLHATPANLLASDGRAALEAAQQAGLLALSAEAVGVADRVVSLTMDYLRSRQQFGRPIGSFQALQHRAVEMATSLQQMRSITIRAAASHGTADGPRHAAMAKLLIGRRGHHIAQEAIQLHGGIAVTWEAEISHAAKRLVMIDAQLGDADWQSETLSDML